MVLLHVKRSEKESFLYETPCATDVDVVLRELVIIHNLRQKVNRLTEQAEQLALHGPMKPPEQQGLDDETPLVDDYDVTTGTSKPRAPVQRNEHYNPDPTERRNGNAPSPELAQVLMKTVEDGKALTSEGLADLVAEAPERGARSIVFCVGGPYGHDDSVREGADAVVSLSGCVLNHAVARLVLLEQIYRAWTIIKGEKYHH